MANRKKSVASISDVAKEAGVSITTVSRVFNKRDSVHPETRTQVLAAAEKIGFHLSDRRPGPKPPARDARAVIRFLYFLDVRVDGGDPETNKTMVLIKRGVDLAAEAAGFRTAYNVYGPGDDVIFSPEDGEVAGVVLIGNRPPPAAEKTLRQYPCCWVMTAVQSPEWGDQVMPDHREVGRLAARYLVEKGHQNIAMLQFGPRDRVHRFREEGFGYEVGKFPKVNWSVVDCGCVSDEAFAPHWDSLAERLVENIKRTSPQPTGIFVDQDRTLWMLYPKLLRAGLVPGDDFEVISCNNLDVYRNQLPFEYKSIDVHFEMVGRLGVGQLLWRLQNPGFSPQARSLVLPELL